MYQQPDWSLLPSRPLEFFSLPATFDRTDLKRAYNALIRQFKPEQHPAEFQQIRSAFEALEDGLRFGTLSMASEGSRPGTSQEQAGSSGIDLEAQIPERFSRSGAASLQQEIEAKAQRSGPEWLALALLRESEDPENPWPFLETLLQGVEATKGNPGLLETLWKTSREPLPKEQQVKLLQQMAKVFEHQPGIHKAWYVFATATHWEKLVTTIPFPTFAKLLARCQELLGEGGYRPFLVLRLQLLSKGALRVDSDWRQNTIADLEEDYSQLSEDVQNEFDRYGIFADYLDHREAFLDGSSARSELDKAILAALTETELEADRIFLAAAGELFENREELFEAFPTENDPSVAAALQAFQIQAAETYARYKSGDPYLSEAVLGSRINEFMYRLEREVRRTRPGWIDRIIDNGTFIAFVAPIFGLLYWLLQAIGLGEILGQWTVLTVIGLTFLVLKFSYHHLVGKVMQIWDPHMYRKAWRHRTANFMAENYVEHFMLCRTLSQLKTKGVTDQYRLVNQAVHDPALAFFSLVLAFE